ncbi:hypothetical protein GCM10007862_07410 [Dyella lipolytica]|nr:hypothetical protein GCM10007862_07410 [Dyella lipolytica]
MHQWQQCVDGGFIKRIFLALAWLAMLGGERKGSHDDLHKLTQKSPETVREKTLAGHSSRKRTKMVLYSPSDRVQIVGPEQA